MCETRQCQAAALDDVRVVYDVRGKHACIGAMNPLRQREGARSPLTEGEARYETRANGVRDSVRITSNVRIVKREL